MLLTTLRESHYTFCTQNQWMCEKDSAYYIILVVLCEKKNDQSIKKIDFLAILGLEAT